jgi:RNA polymerase sigma factor (sigma-70 family)
MSGAEITDAELVSASLTGNRDAFGRIVTRYQSLVCSLAYSATGCLGQSEDLAQETFITAWNHLRYLREPGKLRAWLCGIARNRINNSLRREGREPLRTAESLDVVHDVPAVEPLPPDHAISKEEEAILWRSLERIPETYREPLVLFYREHQSIERVAEELELSEDAVKQRLSRGRKMLHEQVLAFIEGALERTNPGKAFTLGVLAALPVFATSASAATAGAAAVKGSSAAKASALLGISGAILGPLVGILGAWVGFKASLTNAQSEREREFIRKSSRATLILVLLFCAALFSAIFLGNKFWRTYPILITTALLALSIGYVVALFATVIQHNRRLRQIRAEEVAAGRASVVPNRQMFTPMEYRSRQTLLGWPLLHIRMGTSPDGKRAVAKGWIAMGDVAFGLIAFGGVSVGVVSVGGASVGLVAIGGAAVGLLTFAGMGIGVWAIGGCAIGYLAYGGSALAWHAACGGAAMAHEFALGGAAIASHANDEVARAVIYGTPFFQHAQAIMAWTGLLICVPMGLVLWEAIRLRKAVKSSE